MQIVNYVSSAAIPLTILIIVAYGIIEKRKVFDDFLEGAEEGIKIVIKMLPTLIGLFVAIGLLRSSGILDLIISAIIPITNIFQIPEAVIPLAILRPISGSSSLAVATEIMNVYGVDSFIGLVTSTIMGATETTIYTIAIYASSVGIKKTRFVLIAALCRRYNRDVGCCNDLANFVVKFFRLFLDIFLQKVYHIIKTLNI